MVSYSKAIKKIAAQKKISISDLCKAASLSRSYDKKLNDDNWNPKIITLSKLCQALDVDLINFCHFANTGSYNDIFPKNYIHTHTVDFVYSSKHLAYAIKTILKVQNKSQYSMKKESGINVKSCFMLAKTKPDNQLRIASIEAYASALEITVYAFLMLLQNTAAVTYNSIKESKTYNLKENNRMNDF